MYFRRFPLHTINLLPHRYISRIAGSGEKGFSGDGGHPLDAALNFPGGVAVAPDGSIVVVDTWNHRLRMISKDGGTITTIAGCGGYGSQGDGGPAIEACLQLPDHVLVTEHGDIIVSDGAAHRVRKIDGNQGTITTLAGTGKKKFGGDGGPATEAMLNSPRGLAVTQNGDILIGDHFNHRIRRVDGVTGVITTIAGIGKEGEYGLEGDGGPADEAQLNECSSIALNEADGCIFFRDWRAIRMLLPNHT